MKRINIRQADSTELSDAVAVKRRFRMIKDDDDIVCLVLIASIEDSSRQTSSMHAQETILLLRLCKWASAQT